MKKFKCLNCNIEVVVEQSVRGREKTKFCSNKCARQNWELEHKQSNKAKEKLFGKRYIQRTLLKTKQSIDHIISELGIQPYYANNTVKYVADKKQTRFNQQQVDMIVERFYQLNKKKKGGTTIQDIAIGLDISWHHVKKIVNQYNFDIEKYTSFEDCLDDFKKLLEAYNNNNKILDDYCDFYKIADLLNLKNKNSKKLRSLVDYYLKRYGRPNGEITKRVENTYKNLWPIKEVEIWLENIEKVKQQEEQEKVQKKQQKEEEKIKREESYELLKKQFENDGYISREEALLLLNRSLSVLDRIKSMSKKLKGSVFYKKTDIEELQNILIKEKQQKEKQSLENKKSKIIRRDTDWTDDLIYDDKKWAEIQKFSMPQGFTENQIDRWKNNYELIENRIQKNIIKTFCCNNCNKELPYYSFNVDIKGGNKFGRYQQCRSCQRKKRYKDPSLIQKRNKTNKMFVLQFTTSIRGELNRKNKKYVDISSKEIWYNIEKYCGYTKDDLIKHIESQFEPWMNWRNNKRPIKPGEKTWQLDHIKPRSSYNYTSMDDLDFIQCWSLDNLKPIESIMNLIKSDVDLMKRCASSFRSGLNDLTGDAFIWKYLPYTPEMARMELEKKYGNKIDWEKFKNSNFEIDHIIPQAFLSFSSFEDENFKKCWDLNNLQILIQNENASKGSFYEGKIWFYNKE